MRRPQRTLPLHTSAETFDEEVLQSSQPVLVDFWASWCPPCMMLKPEVERLATELSGRAKVAFINVDEEPILAGMVNAVADRAASLALLDSPAELYVRPPSAFGFRRRQSEFVSIAADGCSSRRCSIG